MCDVAYQALSRLVQQWEGPGDEATCGPFGLQWYYSVLGRDRPRLVQHGLLWPPWIVFTSCWDNTLFHLSLSLSLSLSHTHTMCRNPSPLYMYVCTLYINHLLHAPYPLFPPTNEVLPVRKAYGKKERRVPLWTSRTLLSLALCACNELLPFEYF